MKSDEDDLSGPDPLINETVKLLLVDDDEVFRALCSRFLRNTPSLNGAVIQLAETASQGMELSRQHHFDCLVVDYRLPDGLGTEMISALREEFGDNSPATIVLTAAGGEEAAIQAIKVEAGDFMPKSEVTRASLNRAISNAIDKSRLKKSLSEQHKELKLAYGSLQKKSEEIKQFYHNVSHEVKTPLTAIREFQQLLFDELCGPLNAEQQELIKYSLESCDQIKLLFNDLLDVTRLEFGKLKIERVMQSPGPLIEQCLTAIRTQAGRVGITLENKLSDDLPDIYVDQHRYVQIIANLLSNALKYTAAGGVITVETRVDTEAFYVVVSDIGCGIDKASIDRVFDRLYQVPMGQGHDASSIGLGLGLSISRNIARQHGGDISVTSEYGVGSKFTVTMPLFLSEHEANAA